jgi:hypothetical protein
MKRGGLLTGEHPMDVSLLRLKSIFRHASGKKGTLLAQALRKARVHEDASRSAGARPQMNAEHIRDKEKTT